MPKSIEFYGMFLFSEEEKNRYYFSIQTAYVRHYMYVSIIKAQKSIYGSIVPILVVISFYPVYKLIAPAGAAVFILVGLYVITLIGFLAIWYKARKNI